jgi:hypothetical protein
MSRPESDVLDVEDAERRLWKSNEPVPAPAVLHSTLTYGLPFRRRAPWWKSLRSPSPSMPNREPRPARTGSLLDSPLRGLDHESAAFGRRFLYRHPVGLVSAPNSAALVQKSDAVKRGEELGISTLARSVHVAAVLAKDLVPADG